ncbi:MAG TPA: hypothetical protein VFP63_02710, partial [Dehalococcoidia bacterium]|nr:hypothetical protein [Dehalococcoidia bacterium]
PAEPPEFFPALTNGGFEDLDSDGMPYGWRKVGGQMSAVTGLRSEGNRALQLESGTTSTKWVYQTVSVETGAYYQASAYALKNDPAVEALFLRLSWYAAENGDGSAIKSVDSLDLLATDAQAFRSLTTGPAQAPPGARSVKVRLMLRPVSDAPAAGYFDDVRLARVPPPAVTAPVTSLRAAAVSVRKSTAATDTPGALGVVSTPVVPANFRAWATPAPFLTAGQGSDAGWIIYASLTAAAASLGVTGLGLWRRQKDEAGD